MENKTLGDMLKQMNAEVTVDSNIVKQWGKRVTDFSSQYGSATSISYTASNLAEESSIYPNYGDFTQACVLRTYGPWWNECQGQATCRLRAPEAFTAQDYIDLSFDVAVHPRKIEVFETYNPGTIVRILACDVDPESSATSADHAQWFVLWTGISAFRLLESHIFSPELRSCPFATKLIRFEFNHNHCDYYTELDGVQLTGFTHGTTKSGLSPRNGSPVSNSSCFPCFNDTPQRTSSNNHGESLQSINDLAQHCDKTPDTISRTSEGPGQTVSQSELITKGIAELHIQDGLSAALDFADNGCFDLLPEEVIQHILSFLDLSTLGKLACVCWLFHKHCYDSHQCTELNLQAYWPNVTNQVLQTMTGRCRHLQKLSLSWCGSYNHISESGFTGFLQSCGRELACLKLACCHFMNDQTIKVISSAATRLQILDLQGCTNITKRGFMNLCSLNKLTKLNLYRTSIDVHATIAVLRCCSDLQHLNLGSCERINNFDEVAEEIGSNCKDMRSLDLWRSRTLTHKGVQYLCENCLVLEELDIGWCAAVQSPNGCLIELVRKCTHLKKLFLTANRGVTSEDLLAIASNLKSLEQLDILGTREVSEEAALKVLKECSKLRLFDVSFCGQISQSTVKEWRETYPHVSIKKSFQH